MVDTRLIGCVKFFDNTAGFGFITVLKNVNFPQFSEKDIFFHFSAIHSVNEKQYKYLLKGEYVEFKIVPSNKTKNTDEIANDEEVKYNAIDITGIQGGKLMCETNYTEFVPKKTQAGGLGAPNYYGKSFTSGVASNDMDVDVVTHTHTPFTRKPNNGQPNYAARINRNVSSNRGPPAMPNGQRPKQILRKTDM
jgi:cold shock CspA family protein